MNKDLNWEIDKQPIYNSEGRIVSGYQQIIKCSPEKETLLSVMKNTYNPIGIGQFKDIVNQIHQETGFEIAGYNEFKEGKIITCQLKSDGILEIGGSKIDGYLTLGTGYDGSKSFFIGHTNEFLRCQNQFGRIIKDFKIRLTTNSHFRIEEVLESILEYKNYEESLYESFQKMETVKINETIVKQCIERLFDLTKEEKLDQNLISSNKQNKILTLSDCIVGECNDLGNNLFGLFNGITKYTTHEMGSRQQDVFGNLLTTKGVINTKGYNIINELMLV